MIVLGQIASYADLHRLMRVRADELQLSRLTIDRLAGLPSGYASKVLAPKPARGLSDRNLLGFMLPALGMKLVAVEDDEILAIIRGKADKRDNTKTSHSAVVSFSLSKRFLRKIGRKGGANSRKYLSRERVTELARKAGKAGAIARWADVKAVARGDGEQQFKRKVA
jgi:hypothetical protein